MPDWPKNPVIYEINTWVWLSDLTRRAGRPVSLGTVPPEEWAWIARLGFDAVWFMGIWKRSPEGIRISSEHAGLQHEFLSALPDFRPEDNLGSAYCIRDYEVDERLGGRAGLAEARRQLASRGMRVLLDFVPNHVARDHPWVLDHPEYFIQGSRIDLLETPHEYFESGGRVYACGKDPNFPAWEDVVQVDAFHPGYRLAVIDTLQDVAAQCDGVRCDMAMLLLNRIFGPHWGERSSPAPMQEFWNQVIPAVQKNHPGFVFIAEAYWGTGPELLADGFSYTYDKELYDSLVQGDSAAIGEYLAACPADPGQLRFIENHDEPRAASAFPPSMARAAAVILATLPGARLFHQGQLEGRVKRLPVFLARWDQEPPDERLARFYQQLLPLAASPIIHDGSWEISSPDSPGILEWVWKAGETSMAVLVNYSPQATRARVSLPLDGVENGTFRVVDPFNRRTLAPSVTEIRQNRIGVDLAPWDFCILDLRPSAEKFSQPLSDD